MTKTTALTENDNFFRKSTIRFLLFVTTGFLLFTALLATAARASGSDMGTQNEITLMVEESTVREAADTVL